MEETVAELRRQLEEVRRAREEEKRAREEAERRGEEQRQAREKAEGRVQHNTLLGLLDRCHISLSQAIQVETDAALTTQGDATDPVNRLYPKRITPWCEFPDLQEKIWKKFDRIGTFTSRPLFPSNEQLDYVATNIQARPIYSEASIRNFERETVDIFVEKVIEALRDDETLRREFGIKGRVTCYDGAETSLENSMEQMTLQNARSPEPLANTRHGRKATQNPRTPSTPQKRNRRANQFCVHTVANERKEPVYAVEFKAPHKEGDTFEYHSTRLVAAVVTQIFSYMIDSGLQYGYICTGEAFVFLRIPEDPTVVQYYLCVPNQDVQANDQYRLHRTAVGQVLAFTLQALAAKAPSQKWHDTAHDKLSTWKVEYLDILREIPETVRTQGRPTSNYRPSHWKFEPKRHNTRSRARCQPGNSTPKHSSTEDSGSVEEHHSPSTAAAARSQASREKSSHDRSNKQRPGDRRATTAEKQHRLQVEVENYNRLRNLQGQQIPVCLGAFKPSISYWYHGELMAQIMILGWSGMRLQHVINKENSSFFDQERKKVLAVLQSHGIIHGDSEWRNMLWDDAGCRLVVIDLEDMKWLKRPRALEPASGNTRHVHRVRDEKSRQNLLSSSAGVRT
ncbi:hypothetical protein N7534_010790 [Penicillium rubens]|nr:hypothetical protein N7534_010790 [Penicillium rubens]